MTPLERLFAEEFCRFVGLPVTEIGKLQIERRSSNEAGFVSTLDPTSVPDRFSWPERFYKPDRTAIVGRSKSVMLMLLVFDRSSGRLESIEGDALTRDWDQSHQPAYWSETQMVIDGREHH